MNKTILSAAVALLLASPLSAQQATDPVAPPTMGWSSWNTFGANISESVIKKQADAMVRYKLKDVGYLYINIDDGFFNGRDANGRLIIHPTRFPNGLKPVADYIHAKGLKAGIYSDAGHNTCASYHGGEKGGIGGGLLDHDDEDCEMYFNEMGFDFIKVDFCGGTSYHNSEGLNLDEQKRYEAIAKAIKKTGCDVAFNVCRWDFPGTWVCDIANSWRTTQDINASWGSVKNIIEQNLYLSAYCGGGHYNDMDMLEVGRGMSTIEDRTHFGMWCIMASPLLIGCDMSSMSASTRNLLSNPDLIALNQDPLGLQAYVVKAEEGTYILVKDILELNGNTRAVALYNPTDKAREMTLDFADVDLAGKVHMRDLFAKSEMGDFEGSYSVTVQAHGTRIFKLTAEHRLMRTLYEAETAWMSSYQEIKNNQWAETAIYEANENCSGGQMASWLGKKAQNDLQWRNVYVDEEGDYDMQIFFLSAENRNISISVNGGISKRLSCNSGSWSKVGSKTVRIHLQAGTNVVRLFNTSGWMPNIDCMRLTFVEGTGIKAIDKGQLTKDNWYDLNGRKLDGEPTAAPGGIYLVGGRKVLKR